MGTFRAFEAGARATNPDVTVLEAFIGSWDDVAAAKEAAVAQLRRGADVLIHNTDAASFGVFQAVREASASGPAWALGMNRDQNDVAPEVTLGSAIIGIPRSFLEVARAYQAGTLGDGPIYNDLGNGGVEFVPNPVHQDLFTEEMLSALDRARAGIRDGTLEIPRIRFVEEEVGEAGGSS